MCERASLKPLLDHLEVLFEFEVLMKLPSSGFEHLPLSAQYIEHIEGGMTEKPSKPALSIR